MRLIFSIEVGIGLLATLAFVAGYVRVPGWWRTPAGRHMMGLTAILATMFTLIFAGRLMGGLPTAVWVVAMGALDTALCGQVLLLARAQRDRPR